VPGLAEECPHDDFYYSAQVAGLWQRGEEGSVGNIRIAPFDQVPRERELV